MKGEGDKIRISLLRFELPTGAAAKRPRVWVDNEQCSVLIILSDDSALSASTRGYAIICYRLHPGGLSQSEEVL